MDQKTKKEAKNSIKANKANTELDANLISRNLTRQNNLMGLIVNQAPVILWSVDKEGIFTLSEGKALTDLNLKPGEVVGQSLYEIYAEYPQIGYHVKLALNGESTTNIFKVNHRFYEVHFSPLYNEQNNIIGVNGISIDFTKHKLVEDELKEKSEQLTKQTTELDETTKHLQRTYSIMEFSNLRFTELFEGLPVACFTCDNNGHIFEWNRACAALFGYKAFEVIEKTIWETICPENLRPILKKWLRNVMNGASYLELEETMLTKEGEQCKILLNFIPFRDHHQQIQAAMFSGIDITERKRMEDELRHLSTHDFLTGLYNRVYFESEMERLQNGRLYPITIFIADVDGMKCINDSYGHAAGDEVLITVGKIINSSLRYEDIAARIGGDEFAVIIPQTDVETANIIKRRINYNINLHNSTNPKHEIKVSVGSATGYSGQSLVDLMQLADRNMYSNKNCSRRNVKYSA